MKKLRTALQSRYLFKILALIFLIIALNIILFYPFQSKYTETETIFLGNVIDCQIDGNKLTITLKSKEKLMVTYYFSSLKELNFFKKNLQLGDKLKIIGKLQKPSNNTVPNLFNYQKYLYNHYIYYIVSAKKIKIIESNTNLLYFFKNKILKRLEKIDETGYIKTFLLGNQTNMEDEMIKIYRNNGISHLFAISGMHISLLTSILFFFLSKVSYNRIYQYGIVIPFLLFYIFLTDYSASIIRATIMFIVSAINQCFNFKTKKIDLMMLTLIIIIIINPFLLIDIGFQFSYTISLGLILFSKKIKNKILSSLYTSYLCFLLSLPICLFYFYQVNLFSIIFNLFMIPFVSIIVFPVSFVTFLFPIINNFYITIITNLEYINRIISKFQIFVFNFKKPSILVVIILYIIIILTLKNKKFLILLLLYLIGFYTIPYIDSDFSLAMIDVGQGDSLLIKYPYKKGNILIDTGGKVTQKREEWQQTKKEYSYIESRTIPYLKSLGITTIHYLILSHGDYNNMGEAINLVNIFKVEKVIFNCGPYNDLEKELIKVLDKKNIPYYLCIKELNINNNKLYFLPTKEYDNENDNSNVIYTELNGYKFMFMGDASTTTEKEILNKYNLPDIDVLKVGHHGSKTSSSKEFINEINPKYSIISVGKNNRYGHPNKEVLETLKDTKIYRTDQDGSIMFKIKNNKLKIETYTP